MIYLPSLGSMWNFEELCEKTWTDLNLSSLENISVFQVEIPEKWQLTANLTENRISYVSNLYGYKL